MHLLKSHTKAITHILQMITFAVVEKQMKHKGEQRKALVEPWCEHWNICSWWKGTSQSELMLNNEEEIKLVTISIVELLLSESIS